MKVDLSGDKFVADMYDRDNGPGAAAIVISELRKNGDVNSEVLQDMHAAETAFAAVDAHSMAETKSTWSKDGNELSVTLGADELGPQLKEAAKKAFEEVTGEKDDETK